MALLPPSFSPTPFCCDLPGHLNPQAQWGVVCALSLLIVYFLLRSNKKKKGDPLERPVTQASLSQQRNVERQMQNLLVELSEMARQITAQLDTRSTRLALMIDDADEKAAMLQRMIDECRAVLATPPPVAAPPVSVPSTSSASLTAPPPGAVYEDGPSLELANAADARHQQVYALADEGRSASDIASHIDRPRGEVELILALRPR